MGLNTRQNLTFLKFKEGLIYLTSDKNCENPYTSLDGKITSMRFGKIKFPSGEVDGLKVRVQSGEDTYGFDLPLGNRQFSSFLNFLSNVDITKEVIIKPTAEDKDGKKYTGLIMVGQNGKFKAKYTKAEPGDLPPMKQIKVKGKLTWDNTDQLEFWKEKLESEIFPLLGEESTSVSEEENTQPEVVDEDLPF